MSIAPSDSLAATAVQLDGLMVLPGQAGWDEARAAWNLAVDQEPAAVAYPSTTEDVVSLVRAAALFGLRIAPQTTGHNARPLPDLRDVILVKTGSMGSVMIDPRLKRARVGAGATWIDVTAPASELGLAPLAGSSPDVGVAGYVLGGGLSWLARKHGLAGNSVTAIEIVTAEGGIRRVDAASDPDLFWALRGGGGNFGVVTSIELELFDVPDVYAGWLAWPMYRAREILSEWSRWVATLPDEVTSVARLIRVPDMPAIPDSVRGSDLLVIDAAMLTPEPAGSTLLEPIRRLAPEIDTFAPVPPVSLSHLHMDPDEPTPTKGDHRLISGLPDEAIDHIVETVGAGTDSPLVVVELRHLGGALARASADHGAVGTLPGEFMLFAGGLPVDPGVERAIDSRIDALLQGAEQWDTGRRYSNFSEEPTDSRLFYSREAYRRLVSIRDRVDPDRIFLANHPIP
jgi:FAD/FMN-containing dehydrogenase